MSKSTQTAETGARHRKIRGRDLNTNDIAKLLRCHLSPESAENPPGIRAVLLGTRDGIHICSIGLSKAEDAARLSALNSSMRFRRSGTAHNILGCRRGNRRRRYYARRNYHGGQRRLRTSQQPLLWVSAEDTQLGMVIHHIRNAADEPNGY